MEKRLKVLFCGDTLVLAGLRASLEARAGIEVIVLDGPAAGEPEPCAPEPCALQPDVVVFDLRAIPPAFGCALLERLPDVLLLGIDSATNRVLAWSGQELTEVSTEDLVAIIRRAAGQASEG